MADKGHKEREVKDMAWFRKKGKYWYFVERIEGKEFQIYIGDEHKVRERLLPKKKIDRSKRALSGSQKHPRRRKTG